jgi:hypothetical protein
MFTRRQTNVAACFSLIQGLGGDLPTMILPAIAWQEIFGFPFD